MAVQIVTIDSSGESREATQTHRLRWLVSGRNEIGPPRLQQAWDVIVSQDGKALRREVEWRDVDFVVAKD